MDVGFDMICTHDVHSRGHSTHAHAYIKCGLALASQLCTAPQSLLRSSMPAIIGDIDRDGSV